MKNLMKISLLIILTILLAAKVVYGLSLEPTSSNSTIPSTVTNSAVSTDSNSSYETNTYSGTVTNSNNVNVQPLDSNSTSNQSSNNMFESVEPNSNILIGENNTNTNVSLDPPIDSTPAVSTATPDIADVDTSDELSIGTVINILMIVVGVVIILLGIAILIRSK